ncbi:MAG: NADH-quinone oxidoreductase subunit J [Bacteroidota bacterium]|nr:NADH-quinone oxidoreductase subunit J [Bacteroidota bacterium]MDP4196628.1 NADH-quinone oxidoreductase subunit J [Bacteroidota bacterium]
MNIYDIVFYLFAAITLVSAFFVVTTRNIVYSAFNLLFTFFGVAGLYVLLGADFVAVVQIMVYVGGILILILFGVMLTNKITNVQIKTGTLQVIPAVIGVLLLAGVLIFKVFLGTEWKSVKTDIPVKTTAFALGKLLITDYVLIFELLGILLLVVLIGAATIARREK